MKIKKILHLITGGLEVKSDIFMKVILSGILICLIVIVFKIDNKEYIQSSTPNVDVTNQGGRVVQIAPNRVGVVDTSNGWEEQLVVFEYNPDTKKFGFISSLPYDDILTNPKENGIPTRDEKYGN